MFFFCKGNVDSVKKLMWRFDIFTRTSGLKANTRKSAIYFGGVKHDVRREIERVSHLKGNYHSDIWGFC